MLETFLLSSGRGYKEGVSSDFLDVAAEVDGFGEKMGVLS